MDDSASKEHHEALEGARQLLEEETRRAKAAKAPKQSRTLWEPEPSGDKPTPKKERRSTPRSKKRAEKNTQRRESSPTDTKEETKGPVVQFNSHEDNRNRGDKAKTPRMLFDPKSGSMVSAQKPAKKVKNSSDTPNKASKAKSNKNESEKKNDSKKGKKNKKGRRRLPRTNGVRYVRDGKAGKPYSADGCNGDMGYGAHLVPGGRMRNAELHAKELETQQSHQIFALIYKSENGQEWWNEANSCAVEEPTFSELELIKGDDKMELLTDAPESPTLKATATEWAPSVMPTATYDYPTKVNGPSSVQSGSITGPSTGAEDDLDDDLDIDVAFDSTANHAGTKEKVTEIQGVDLASLALDGSDSNIFSYGTSGGTWGASGAKSNTDTWGGVLGSKTTTQTGASFLSLSAASTGTWGSTLPGMSSIALTQNGMTAD